VHYIAFCLSLYFLCLSFPLCPLCLCVSTLHLKNVCTTWVQNSNFLAVGCGLNDCSCNASDFVELEHDEEPEQSDQGSRLASSRSRKRAWSWNSKLISMRLTSPMSSINVSNSRLASMRVVPFSTMFCAMIGLLLICNAF
jgi:hypothetical protein